MKTAETRKMHGEAEMKMYHWKDTMVGVEHEREDPVFIGERTNKRMRPVGLTVMFWKADGL